MSEHDHHEAGHGVMFESPAMAAHLELEGEVLAGLAAQAASVLSERCARRGVEVRRVLDIGCGPGVASCDLARQFESASVVAVDGSAAMLERAAARAERLGLASRVELRHVELPADLGRLGRADVVWASMVLHHLGDEVDALRQIRGLLEPGGLLAVLERADPMRVVPEDAALGRPGLWDRLDAAWAAWFADMRAELPGAVPSGDYRSMLAGAGFEVVDDRVLTLELDAPLDEPAQRFAHHHLVRTQAQLERYAEPADLRALDVLLDEHERIRDGARLIATRRLCIATPMPGPPGR